MRQVRRYSLFERDGKSWKRISHFAFPKSVAVRHFQNALLASAIGLTHERRLRVVDGSISQYYTMKGDSY